MGGCRLKICGITDVQTAKCLDAYGVDYAGLVFHKSSPRFVKEHSAKKIAEFFHKSSCKSVGVFTHHSVQEVESLYSSLKLDYIQLHGAEIINKLADLSSEIPKIVYIPVDREGVYNVDEKVLSRVDPKKDFLIYDGFSPGKGEFFSWDLFSPLESFPFFLAGGLTVENVQSAIEIVLPFAVDVSTGVENQLGKKNLMKIKEFVKEVKN